MKIRTWLASGVLLLSVNRAFASPGAEIYKSKCQSCHGATGMAESAAGREMKVKPIIDPSVKKLSQNEMIEQVKDGSNKMPAFKGRLTDTEIKAAVEYFRSFM